MNAPRLDDGTKTCIPDYLRAKAHRIREIRRNHERRLRELEGR